MKRLTNFSKTTMSTAMAAVLTLTLSMCPAVDPLDHNVLLPNPADCSSFYSCNNGVAILMHCPDGLYFNAEWDVCDWPWNAKCDFRLVPCHAVSMGEYAGSSYYDCYGGPGSSGTYPSCPSDYTEGTSTNERGQCVKKVR